MEQTKNSNFTKQLLAIVLLLIWSLTTIILTITIIGIIVVSIMGCDNYGWFSIPRKCIDVISN